MSSDESNSAQLLAHYEGGPKANSPRLGGLKREQLNAAEGGGQHCVWPLLLPAARSACLPTCTLLRPRSEDCLEPLCPLAVRSAAATLEPVRAY